MALPGKKFEPVDENGADPGAEEGTATPTPLEKAKAAAAARAASSAEESAGESTGTAVAAKPAGGVAVVPMSKADPFKQLENVFPVKFNTLTAIMPTQGNFIHKDSNKPLGDKITIELVSTQKHYVLAPGGETEDEEAMEFLKYSDDGITSESGEDMLEVLAAAKAAGYTGAKISERLYLVGCLVDANKLPELNDTMVQIDLPPSSVQHYNRHRLSVAYGVSKGKISPDGQHLVQLEAVPKSGSVKGRKLNWTEVLFTQAK